MIVRGIVPLVLVLVCVQAVSSDEARSFGRRSTHERILREGYPAEYYDVTTEDGYILRMNRIPRGKNDFNNFRGRPVAFLMHGLQGSANAYIELGPEKSLAYILADVGFDVWLGNARGVELSRRHVSLSPDSIFSKKQFWDFSFEDIALYDLPAMIDFVLNHTKQQRLHYIGHSQGGTVFLVLNSVKPEYNDKFVAAHLLAGVGYQNHFPNLGIKLAAIKVDDIYNIAKFFGLVELKPNKIFLEEINALSTQEVQPYGMIGGLINLFENAMTEMIRTKSQIATAGLKQYAHYGQNIRDKKFRSWDYGALKNFAKYGSFNPPEYDIRKVTVDTTMHYGTGDILLHEFDVLRMARDMRNCKTRKVPRWNFSHTDFVISDDSKELVIDYIVGDLVKRI